jgi:hypothetical protein
MINNGLERKVLPGKDEKKTRTFFSQDIRCHGRDSNRLSPEYMSPNSPSATLLSFTQYTLLLSETASECDFSKDKYQCNQYVFGTFLEGYSPNLRYRVIGYGRATEEPYFDFQKGEEIILF